MKAPYKAIEFILDNAPKYAEAKAQRIYLEEFRKTKKALLMKDALARGIDSGIAQEREAYAHYEYQELLLGLQVAIEKEETLKWKLIAAQMKSDIWRSEQASERLGVKTTEQGKYLDKSFKHFVQFAILQTAQTIREGLFKE